MSINGKNLPVKEKYIDKIVGIWFIFGEYEDGCVDIIDVNADIIEHIQLDKANLIIKAQKEFREELYKILCEIDNAEDK